MRIAKNLIIDELRRRKSRPAPRRLLWETVEVAGERTEPGPDEQVWQIELRAAVRAACNELSSDQRSVVALAYFGGLT
jgi:RNA polymerase sigma factor (sigma-70 family)